MARAYAPRPATSAAWRQSSPNTALAAVEEGANMLSELFGVLVEEPVTGVWVDAQLGVGQVLCEQATVLGDHERIVVAGGDQSRLDDRGQSGQLRRVRDPPARERRKLCVAGSQV